MSVTLMEKRETGSGDIKENKESQENDEKTSLKIHSMEKEKNNNPADSLSERNFKAKLKLAKELSDMGLSRDDIFRILNLEK